MYAYIRAYMQPQGELSVEWMCHSLQVSRAGFYRSLQQKEPDQEEMLLRDRLHAIALEHRCYGSRRLTAMLKREGLLVNRKRVQRLVREDNLLAVRRRRFTTTTNSDHKLVVYPNLAKRMVLNGSNQLWVADLTYIRLQREFVYLAVVLDAYSRRVIGWALDRSLKASLTVGALEKAFASRQIESGLVHHSDRGVQYACSEYVSLLQQRDIVLSMSRAGNPYDNARCESFMKTLKHEELDGQNWASLEELEQDIDSFIEDYYNQKRLHSALGYCSPVEFEQQQQEKQQAAPESQRGWPLGAGLSFSWHEEIYPDASAPP
jgi:transposase InsO family protein